MDDVQYYVQDKQLWNNMKPHQHQKKNRERIKTRTTYETKDIIWFSQKDEWKFLVSIVAIQTQYQNDEKENG